MNLLDIVQRASSPAPWSEGDNIPWNEPEFSARMLREHLSQEHDLASRRSEKIDRHVQWIHTGLLQERPGRILDLGCGPGFYAARLAQLGHTCTGIDFSPASVAYAQSQNSAGCTFHLGDLRTFEFGQGYDFAMLIYGEFNVFSPQDIGRILAKASAALVDGGILLLEAHTFEAVQRMGADPDGWFTQTSGLFGDQPHLVLMDNHWDADLQAATQRYYVIDAASAGVTRFAASYQGYSQAQYTRLLEAHGFTAVTFYPALGRSDGEPDRDLIAIRAQKGSAPR